VQKTTEEVTTMPRTSMRQQVVAALKETFNNRMKACILRKFCASLSMEKTPPTPAERLENALDQAVYHTLVRAISSCYLFRKPKYRR